MPKRSYKRERPFQPDNTHTPKPLRLPGRPRFKPPDTGPHKQMTFNLPLRVYHQLKRQQRQGENISEMMLRWMRTAELAEMTMKRIAYNSRPPCSHDEGQALAT